MHFLAPAELRGIDASALEQLLGRTDMIVAAGTGEVHDLATAALFFADYAVLDRDAVVHIDANEAWAAAAWRLGRNALKLYLDRRTAINAADAKDHGLVDEIIDGDPQRWLDRWMQGRSELALDSAAALIRSRGGDALERAEFSRLFAIGEPQQGLRAFLGRRSNFV